MNKRNINILIVLLSSFIITIGIIIPTVFASSISISFNPKGGQGVLNGKKKGIYHYLKANRIPKFQIKKSTHGAVKASLYRSKFLVDEPLGTRTTTVGNHYYKKTTTSSSKYYFIIYGGKAEVTHHIYGSLTGVTHK